LEQWVKRHPDRWLLGQGAVWHARHTQALHQTLGSAGPEADEPALLCQVGFLHPIYLEAQGAIGHTLVMGAPGTGKTQLFNLLALQAIARGETVILLDPKGGSHLRQSLARAAERVGRPFFQLLPADPAQSDCLDLLANGRQASELASRLSRLIPADETENVFGQFAWMTLHRIIEGLLVLREPVTLKALRFHVADQGKALRVRLQALGVGTLSEAWRGIADLAAHDATHYRKMILALTPVLETLTAGPLGDLLSPPLAADAAAAHGGRPRIHLAQIIRQAGVLYAGLGALSDEVVARALGGLLLADLAAVAGDRYRDAGAGIGVRVFVDEASEVTNPAFIQILNKGRECGMMVTFAVQTLADLEVAMNGPGPARMMVGNAGNLIAFRTLDPDSRKVWSERAGTTWIRATSASVSAQRAQGLAGWRRGVAAGRSEQLQETPLIPEAFLGHLPNLHFVGLLGGNRVVVGRLPLVN
ncbi:MAG: type IV secretion system DNA-binding domain-containing protein, partial [Betaproteobacteria bacterium]|nr:type IV secretion system DNA-binding domain-containing protein [Betaproteobacteria bacterium]